MGYDVSFHPISPEEMREWYFTPLSWVQQGQEEKVLALAAQHGMEDFYAEKYLDTLRVGAGTEPDELFDKSHGFYIAVIQGFFRDYYYTRGSAFSFLVEEKPEYARYFTPWAQVTPTAFPNPAENQIIENYCSGVYLSPKQVTQLLRDLEQDPKVLEDLEDESFVMLGSEFSTHQDIKAACHRAGFEPKVVLLSSQWDFVVQMVRRNFGVAFLPLSLFRRFSFPDSPSAGGKRHQRRPAGADYEA